MARLLVVSTLMTVLACTACGANTASQERTAKDGRAREIAVESPPVIADAAAPDAPAVVAVPDNPSDKAIRRELNLAIARDPNLKQRRISFIVANGDVSVNGTVGSEEERRKINELAMNVPGVKSIANALLISE